MIQSANADGQGNVIVQIDGDRNTVNLRGLAHLTLTRFLNLRNSKTDIHLLSPVLAIDSTWSGASGRLADLHAWLEGEKQDFGRVLTGQAGAERRGLALELCESVLVAGIRRLAEQHLLDDLAAIPRVRDGVYFDRLCRIEQPFESLDRRNHLVEDGLPPTRASVRRPAPAAGGSSRSFAGPE